MRFIRAQRCAFGFPTISGRVKNKMFLSTPIVDWIAADISKRTCCDNVNFAVIKDRGFNRKAVRCVIIADRPSVRCNVINMHRFAAALRTVDFPVIKLRCLTLHHSRSICTSLPTVKRTLPHQPSAACISARLLIQNLGNIDSSIRTSTGELEFEIFSFLSAGDVCIAALNFYWHVSM